MRKEDKKKALKITLAVFAPCGVINSILIGLVIVYSNPEWVQFSVMGALILFMITIFPLTILTEKLKHKFGCITWTESTTDFTDKGLIALFYSIEQHDLRVAVLSCGVQGLMALKQLKHFDEATRQDLYDMGYRGEFWGASVLFNTGQEDIRASTEPEFDPDAFFHAIGDKYELYKKIRYKNVKEDEQ